MMQPFVAASWRAISIFCVKLAAVISESRRALFGAPSCFIVKKKTTGYARGAQKAMPMRRKRIGKGCKESNMVEYRHKYRD